MKYQLVWAKVEPWPFWPAIAHKISKSSSYRVTFVDKTWSEDDVSVSLLVPFDQSAQELSFEDSDLEWAVKKGLELLESTEAERQHFVDSFKYPTRKRKTTTTCTSLCPKVSLCSSSTCEKTQSSISEYERIRLENIQERKRLFKSLQFKPIVPTLIKTSNPPKKRSGFEFDLKRRKSFRSIPRKIEAIQLPLKRRKSLRPRKSSVNYNDVESDNIDLEHHEGMRTNKRSSKDLSDDDEIGSEEEFHVPSKRSFISRSSLPPPKRIFPNEVTREILGNIAVRSANKIYDQMSGSTCHQCRQKTLDTKTSCRSKSCIGVRGQFCGICLKNRYGELVEEALLDPNWKCPVCLGICNCSVCRNQNGKGATGALTRISLIKGFKSVKHYLQSLS
ncbi:CDCA7 [Lepeophtheirus salmonis]|uniref:CDCA7 n=1 Tax=Lepeophtheirus salmonis TaxID=72036 RepID=A0A7R8GZS4_LEPSM|nr:CDCA7 [Lepeophtheirus salmonis]CAF2769953.1 CDCA7 [Lepeophtheirus salmonis]